MSKFPILSKFCAAALVLGLAVASFGQRGGGGGIPGVTHANVAPQWFSDNNKFWYRVSTGTNGEAEFILVDAVAGTRAAAFDHAKLAAALGKLYASDVQANKLPFNAIKFSDDGKSVLFNKRNGDGVLQCDLSSYVITDATGVSRLPEPAAGGGGRGRRGGGGGGGGGGRGQNFADRAKSPDGKWEAFVKDDNLYVRDLATKEEAALTFGASTNNSYHRDATYSQGVGMNFNTPDAPSGEPEVYWAPDSKHLIAIATKPGITRRVYYVLSSPTDQEQPELKSYPYLKAGDEIPIHKPHLFDIATKKEIPVSDALFENPWENSDFQWNKESTKFSFLFNQRGHQVLRILSIDAATGAVKPIVEETSKTFIDYSGKTYRHDIGESEIIWASERDGWNHLYLYDAQTGQVKNQITKGEWVMRGVDSVDEAKRQIYFHAGGLIPGQDPYYLQYCRINFDGTGLTKLTEGDGYHGIMWSPDRRFIIDTYSRVDMPPVTELRSGSDGHLVCKLEEADDSGLLATGWLRPERFVAKGRDGVTDIYGIIERPRHFDPSKKYPIVEDIYAGPQGGGNGGFVPKTFGGPSRNLQNLADKGIIIVQIDGMGTSWRSRAFHDVIFKNIEEGGFPDRVLWIKAAAAKYTYMDVDRVGIFGTSAGGQNALAGMLTYPDFYKVGVADSGSHDNRMDKIWWNEQWMGWPVGPEYAERSNVTLAHNLKGKLMIMIGEADQNVDPSTSMQVVNALVKANKDFEMFVMPGSGHGVAGSPYGQQKLQNFLVHNLIDSPPKPGVDGSKL